MILKIAIRCDASVQIGSGHVMRCLTLANQLRYMGAEVVFICRDLPGAMFNLIHQHGFRFEKLDNSEPFSQEADANDSLAALRLLFPKGVTWLVVDHYQLNVQWELMLRPAAARMMVIDDLANRSHDCDLLLDQNYYHDFDYRYKNLVPPACVTFLGPSYVLLRQEFIKARRCLRTRDGSVRRIMIFFGGSDPTNQTQRVIEALPLMEYSDVQIDVVVGSNNPNRHVINTLCGLTANVSFHCQVDNMAELISNADIAIGAGGSAMWERCYLGLPTLTVVFSDHQKQTTKDVNDVGAIKYLGLSDQLNSNDYADAITVMIANSQAVSEMSNICLELVPQADTSVAEAMVCLAQ